MNEKKKLLKNTGLIAIGNMGAKIMSLILLPLYTSILTTEEYGIYDYIVAVSAFLIPIVTVSMNEAMFRFIIEHEHMESKIKQIISTTFVTEILGISILGGPILLLHFIFHFPYLQYIWIYIAANVLYTFSTYLLRGLGKIKIYSILAFGKTAFQLVLNVIVVAILKWGLQGMLFALCFSEICAFIVVFCFNKLWEHIHITYFSKEMLKSMFSYSLPLIPNSLGTQIIHLSDRIIISIFLGPAINGIYSIAYKFPSMIEVVYNYFYLAWSENASQVLKKGKESACKYYRSLHNQVDNFIFSVVLLLVASMGIIFHIFIKGEYSSGFVYVPLLAFSMYFDCMAKFYSGIFTALKKTKIMATSTIKAALINVVINIILISKMGLYAAALSTLLAEAALFFFRRRDLKQDIDFGFDLKKEISKIFICSIILLLYTYNNFLKIILSVLIAILYMMILNKELILYILNKLKENMRE